MMTKSLTGFIVLSMLLFLLLPGTAFAATWNDVVDEIELNLNEAIILYEEGEVEQAKDFVNEGYFGPYEQRQMEKAVKFNLSAKRNAIIEEEFRLIKKLMTTGNPSTEVNERVSGLITILREDANELDQSSNSAYSLFLTSFLIILREGFEAILILGAIIAYLIKSGNKEKVKVIYQSAIAALGASILTAIAFKYVFKISGASQEILEGVTMLIAVGVLFSVSYWLVSKSEAEKWQQYIEGKVKTSLKTGNTMALWLAAFLAVYREGAETVLFYQALVNGQSQGNGMILLGFIIGCLALVGIFRAVRYGSVKMPLKPFFIGTSALMYYLAFVFAGEGVRELQAGALVGSTSIDGVPVIGFLGVYPTIETLFAQGLLVLAAVLGFGYQLFFKSKQKRSYQA